MDESRISALLAPVLDKFDLELAALDVVPAGKRSILRVVVDGDGPQGRGPLLDDIAEATKAVSEALDTSDVVGGRPYTLEVSSRGTSRPLTAPQHWRRNRGRLVQVTEIDGSHYEARVLSSGADSVELDRDGEQRRVSMADITKAVVQVELRRTGDAASADYADEVDDDAGGDTDDDPDHDPDRDPDDETDEEE